MALLQSLTGCAIMTSWTLTPGALWRAGVFALNFKTEKEKA
jgi:hypothetical protein